MCNPDVEKKQPLPPDQQKDLDLLFNDFDGKQKYYKDMTVKMALGTVNNSRSLRFARVTFGTTANASPSQSVQDYGKLILAEIHLQPKDFANLIESIAKEHILKVGDFRIPVGFQFVHQTDRFVSSNRGRYGYAILDWPHTYYHFIGTHDLCFENGPFLKPGLSPHPNLDEAISSHFNQSANNHFDNRIEVILPDYRAQIEKLRINGRNIAIKIDGFDHKDLSLQMWTRNSNGKSSYSETIPLGSSPIDYASPDGISQVIAYIIDKNGTLIDEKEVDLRHSSIPDDVEVIDEVENLEAIIKRGESDTVEFKETYAKDKVLRAIVAFANTHGGIILIGINDECEVAGVKDDFETVKASLTSNLSKNCEPAIRWTLNETTIRDEKILVIRVPEGDNKPYVLSDHGVYVRSTGSSRIALRRELDDFYQKNTAPYPAYPF